MDELQKNNEKSLDIRDEQELFRALNLADTSVYKTYLEGLNQLEIVPCAREIEKSDLNEIARLFKVERFVYEKYENTRDKLISVFHSAASCGGSVLILINSNGEKIDYYFGAKVPAGSNSQQLIASANVLKKSFNGNFPGTEVKVVPGGKSLDNLTRAVFENNTHEGQEKQICTITGVAGLRSKEESQEKHFIQSMEKLIDSMQGETYSLLLIADPVQPDQLNIIKRGYENLYSQLVPFAGSELNFGQNESESVSNSITDGLSKSINKSVTDTLTYTKGTSESTTEGTTDTFGGSAGGSIGSSTGRSVATTIGISIAKAAATTLSTTISAISPFASVAVSVAKTVTETITRSFSETVTDSFSENKSLNASGNYSHTTSKSKTIGTNESESEGKSKTDGTTETASTQKGKTDTAGEGTSRNIQLKFENKAVKNLMEKIDLQLKRLDASADTGMWNCSVYCLADTSLTCKVVASAYLSLLRGENSSVETGVLTEWTKEKIRQILPYIRKMHHPKLKLEDTEITPTSFISGAELSIHAGIPQSSVSGLPVVEMASFGREVAAHWEAGKKDDDHIELGKIYHMGKEEKLPVNLNRNSLASHTFITGSTGSGKSNTVCRMLDQLDEAYIPFLVIEPAKGEYKHAFSDKKNVSVYGTNPDLAMMLRINPFKFNKGIHILEHLDRLIEIFNVCWPMYAAMPAVLKEAVECSYEQAGWDLQTSKNRYGDHLFPTFKDVCANIFSVINSSEYSEENKGNYKGALVTRLNSLTNGINGMIFVNDELSNEELFDKNVIVDLSRVGSVETKALIMGLLIMKLQEYRMTSGDIDSPLRHITVLEEAHNLLKRTSTEQSGETANLLGKSVEMLANAIAEMRTYGEGFIIADQSPGLLDMSVIRNTNTKIILRLPDESDRELVGRAASLNDDQIVELAKLQQGVAAVYQNDWIQPVLCRVCYFEKPEGRYKADIPEASSDQADSEETSALKKRITRYLLSNIVKELQEFSAEKTSELRTIVLHSGLNAATKTKICDFLSKQTLPQSIEPIADIIGEMYICPKKVLDKVIPGYQVSVDWAKMFNEEILPSIGDFTWEAQKYIMQCIAIKGSIENVRLRDLPNQLRQVT